MSSSTARFQRSIVLDGTPAALWPLLSDTNRVNRMMGLPASERVEAGENATLAIRARYMGVPVAWREPPFQWVFEQWFVSERIFDAPFPVSRVVVRTALVPQGQQTRVDVDVVVESRWFAGWLAAHLVVARQFLDDMLKVYRIFERAAAMGRIPPARSQPKVSAARLQAAQGRLAQLGVAGPLAESLVQHIRTAADADVVKMRPFALADQWRADRQEVLRLCLYATRAGLLDLEWDVVCPGCRGVTERATTLGELAHQAHCAACNIHYHLNFDEAVELRFSVSPDIREAYDATYCVGGPANTRHIVAQLRVPAGGQADVALRLAPGAYRIRAVGAAGQADVDVREGGAGELALALGQDVAVAPATLAAGGGSIQLANPTDADMLVLVEERTWTTYAASAAMVTAMAEFRTLFSSEVLSPGVGMAVRTMTFLFSDLKDSTAIYDSIGDAPAYARVRDHFALMRRIIDERHGTLVKTIGDAVMAVFPSAGEAGEAAVAIQREFTLGEIAQGRPSLRVKLGVHRGPCIVVNANGLLDYFGSTVNTAARIQGESLGGDIVLSSAVMEDEAVRAMVERERAQVEPFERQLKGISQLAMLHRLWLPEAARLAATPPAALADRRTPHRAEAGLPPAPQGR